MSRVQLGLNVDDLDTAIGFYTALFGTEPAKVEPGYANFAIENPPLKLVLFEGAGDNGTINHMGIEHTTPAEVHTELDRVREAGLQTHSEGEAHCCYAHKDEGWIDGADGHRWEIYAVTGHADTAGSDGPTQQACCA